MTALVHVSGRRAPYRFERWSTAEYYREVMIKAGRFAWVTYE